MRAPIFWFLILAACCVWLVIALSRLGFDLNLAGAFLGYGTASLMFGYFLRRDDGESDLSASMYTEPATVVDRGEARESGWESR